MTIRNQLFFIIFTLDSLVGCGTTPQTPARAGDARPVAATGAVQPATPANAPPVPPTVADERDTDMLFHALMAAGVDYRRGGRSHQRGFDCSGLVAHVYREAYGLALPHNSKAQSELGLAVDRFDLLPGDLVFFNTLGSRFSHVGIYVGEGRFIHAPKEGAVVRTESLQARYWAARYDGARRIVPTFIAAEYPQPASKSVLTHP